MEVGIAPTHSAITPPNVPARPLWCPATRAAAVKHPLSAGISALVGVDDLAAGGKPDALVLFDFSDGALQIFDAQGLAGDHRMQRNAHHPRLLLAVGVERLELIDHGAVILLPGVAFANIERDVVDLHA